MAKKPKFGDQKFLEYTQFIIKHPAYTGMPDIYGEKGKIQWEAPSNRKSGKYKDTHQKRLDWWRKKAISIGLNPSTGKSWISRTAKTIHPTKKKPCKNCGQELNIEYCYPSKTLVKRIQALSFVPPTFEISPIEHVCDIVERLVETFGDQAFSSFPALFRAGVISVPPLSNNIQEWKNWLIKQYIPQEPSTLSPGAMSNAPDRFDGFHSFNRCCREKSDKGRTKENLQSYSTDRRVFEYWVDGDWVAADRLMGQVRSKKDLKQESCFNGADKSIHALPCQADHIGPISLGFAHRTQFQFLCKSCNSGKNNRMYESDVKLLLAAERKNEAVTSWFAKSIWDARKMSVSNSETALRLSKLMRDNRHTYMAVLERIFEAGHLTFLSSFLSLEKADFDPEFIGLKAEDHLTVFDKLTFKPRTTKYAVEQKARRIRIAFQSLSDYRKKDSRNSYVVWSDPIEKKMEEALALLRSIKKSTDLLDDEIAAIFLGDEISEEELRTLATVLPANLEKNTGTFKRVMDVLKQIMELIAQQLSSMWNDDRYIRAGSVEDDSA